MARTKGGGLSIGRIDLCKHGSFLLEADEVTAVLESLAAVGVAVEVTAPQSAERRWRATR